MKQGIYFALLILQLLITNVSCASQNTKLFPFLVAESKLRELENGIESLTEQIGIGEIFNNRDVFSLYNERGILLFFSGEYDKALADFNYVLRLTNCKIEYGCSLWGKVWSHAFQNNEKELMDDLRAIAEFIGMCENCEDEALLFDAISMEPPKFLFCDAYCENTVNNMVDFMKGMCVAIKDPGIMVALGFFIDGLGEKAKNCCKAGGFWRTCVDPMVQTANRWKIVGIPADPYWD